MRVPKPWPRALQVSSTGDIVYALPRDFQASIRARSWLLRAQPALAKLAAAGQYLVRVTFGTALITSVLLVWVTIMAILTSSQSSSNDDRRCAPVPLPRFQTPKFQTAILCLASGP